MGVVPPVAARAASAQGCRSLALIAVVIRLVGGVTHRTPELIGRLVGPRGGPRSETQTNK